MANAGEERERREEEGRFKTFTPIIPRLERLDYLMRRLEEKQKQQGGSRCSTQSSRGHHQRTLSSAVQEVHQKGSLLDRIASLENRLFQKHSTSKQLSLDMEVSSTSSSSTAHMSGWSSYDFGQGRRRAACAISPSHRAKKNSGRRRTGTSNPEAKPCRERNAVQLKDFLEKPIDGDEWRQRRWFSMGC